MPRLTQRRVLGGVLVLAGAVLLMVGAWQQSPALLVLGLGTWTAALIALTVLVVRRVNALQSRLQSSGRALEKLLRRSEDLRKEQAKTAQAQARGLERVSSAETAADAWHQAHAERVGNFQKQFGDFVATVAQWMAIAELEGKRVMAVAQELEQRLDDVEGRLENVDGRLENMEQTMRRLLNTTAAKRSNSILPYRTELARLRVEAVQELEAILQLRDLFPTRQPMPLLGGWAMSPISMLGIVNELVARQPKLVLECGSGTSTLWIAKALKHIGTGRLISLEHDERFHEATSRALAVAGVTDVVDLRFVPLRPHRLGNEQFQWYELQEIDVVGRSIEFLVIDGPPDESAPLARYPALPLLEPWLADGAVVIVDDADRPEEQEEISRWVQRYPGLQELGEMGERTKIYTYSLSGVPRESGLDRLEAL